MHNPSRFSQAIRFLSSPFADPHQESTMKKKKTDNTQACSTKPNHVRPIELSLNLTFELSRRYKSKESHMKPKIEDGKPMSNRFQRQLVQSLR